MELNTYVDVAESQEEERDEMLGCVVSVGVLYKMRVQGYKIEGYHE